MEEQDTFVEASLAAQGLQTKLTSA